jgi:hypothetical protein
MRAVQEYCEESHKKGYQILFYRMELYDWKGWREKISEKVSNDKKFYDQKTGIWQKASAWKLKN